MKGDRLTRVIILIVAIVIVLGGAGYLLARYLRTDEVSDIANEGGRLSVMIAIELPGGRLMTETLFVDTGANRAALFDIPANTGVVVSSLNRVDGIDTVYWSEGIDSYRAAVSDLLDEDIAFYLVMDTSGLETLTDIIEGVPLFVADVPTEGPDAIRIPTGDVVLDGAKIGQYVAYEPEGERDRERIARFQKATAGLVRRIGEKRDLVADPAASLILSEALQMNMDRAAFVSFAEILSRVDIDRMITRQVEGTMRAVETGEESEALLFPHQEGRWLAESVRQVVDNLRSTDVLRDENIVITVEILNGTGSTGLARRTADLYESYGFDVVTIGNAAREDVTETVIIDRVGNEVFANRTAEIIRAPLIDLQPSAAVGVDVTIVLGEDFDGRFVR